MLLNFECIFTFATRFRQAFFATVQSTGVARIFFGDQGPKPRRGESVAKLLEPRGLGVYNSTMVAPVGLFLIHRFQVWVKEFPKKCRFCIQKKYYTIDASKCLTYHIYLYTQINKIIYSLMPGGHFHFISLLIQNMLISSTTYLQSNLT